MTKTSTNKPTKKKITPLTLKGKTFVEEYIQSSGNAAKAATKANYAAKRMPAQPAIVEEIGRRSAEIAAKYEITTDRVVEEFSHIAFFDPRELFEVTDEKKPDVFTLIPLHRLPRHVAAAISSIEVGDDGVARYKINDKIPALNALGRHLGMSQPDTHINIINIPTMNEKARRVAFLLRSAAEHHADSRLLSSTL